MGVAAHLTRDGKTEIFVVDAGNYRIQVFTPEGKFLRQWGREGDGDGEFEGPTGVAVLPSTDGESEIAVTDRVKGRVQVFSSKGEFLRKWGRRGSLRGDFKIPRGIAALSGGGILVADEWNHRIQAFTREGEYQFQWIAKGKNDIKLSPTGVAILPLPEGGNAIVVTDLGGRVKIFSFAVV